MFARNAGAAAVEARVAGRIGAIVFEKRVPLAAGESREVAFTPAEVPQLVVHDPKLWWPAQYGTPTLHRLELTATAGGQLSDRAVAQFGIREFTLRDDAGRPPALQGERPAAS